jgi:hypothetical protein
MPYPAVALRNEVPDGQFGSLALVHPDTANSVIPVGAHCHHRHSDSEFRQGRLRGQVRNNHHDPVHRLVQEVPKASRMVSLVTSRSAAQRR